ncbi:hypothetical protein MMC13_003538 [Lambiella insularis]|nr:hypothetical protein [Lambiella insularis]
MPYFSPRSQPALLKSIHSPSLIPQLSVKSRPESRPAVQVMDFFHSSHGKDKRRSVSGSPKLVPAKPAKLDIAIESPPLVMYGPTTSSSGALFSGQLKLNVSDEQVKLQQFEMQLLARTTTKKPISKDCPDCRTQSTELHKWTFLSEPARFSKGSHSFPFSYLLPGKLPATVSTVLGSIDYLLSAKATTSLQDVITIESPLSVARALSPSSDRTSLRIFPPTNLTATIILPAVVHPIGEFKVQMRISGCAEDEGQTQRRWRIRKTTSKIEEHTKMISPPCEKHVNKVGGEGKGILSTDTRVIGGKEFRDGWKSDFETKGGLIEMEFPATFKTGSNPICDVEAPNGLSVSHKLLLELIVAEEIVSLKNTKLVTPTGTARVLRMQFLLIVTQRSGLGISWDEEQPPMYDDVPASPPSYAKMVDYEGEPLPDEELSRMR